MQPFSLNIDSLPMNKNGLTSNCLFCSSLRAKGRRSLEEQAIYAALMGKDYTQFEKTFQISSQYWQRRGGMDHVFVMGHPPDPDWPLSHFR